ncbi:MAG: M24 family metallopeptidase, partial [Candidatus Woesearchaeota archaeon]|nr:M24 family metallopeptidase [Candidatus Woesearchaeota archaeon]
CADHTYTHYDGNNKEIKDAVEAVRESQAQSQKLAVRGASGALVTKKALDVLAEYGYREYTYKDVGLGLGHGVGLEVHDGHRRIDDVETLQTGMCFTVEPGLYFPKKFGVRFEEIAFI